MHNAKCLVRLAYHTEHIKNTFCISKTITNLHAGCQIVVSFCAGAKPPKPPDQGLIAPGPHWGKASRPPIRLALSRSPRRVPGHIFQRCAAPEHVLQFESFVLTEKSFTVRERSSRAHFPVEPLHHLIGMQEFCPWTPLMPDGLYRPRVRGSSYTSKNPGYATDRSTAC
jgi:hypothetical protein